VEGRLGLLVNAQAENCRTVHRSPDSTHSSDDSTIQQFNDSTPPCVLHEDEHLLAVNKPAGWNTHAPSAYAGEGIYDWLKHREPRWASLAIIHRLDKETSGVMVFGKTPLANRSLTEQFTKRSVRKTYLLLTDRAVPRGEIVVKSKLARTGERYASGTHGDFAETRFAVPAPAGPAHPTRLKAGLQTVAATPLTGRTHQIRVHAAERRFPIFGDKLYGGTPFPRVCLHAMELKLRHPATGEDLTFRAPVDFGSDPRRDLREAILEPAQADAFRVIHGASDGQPGWYVDRLGGFLLSQSEALLSDEQQAWLAGIGAPSSSSACGLAQTLAELELGAPMAAYHKILSRQVRRSTAREASPQLAFGQSAPERFVVRENGVKFELSFNEGYSVGLFLDQRDNRRRLLSGHVAAGFELAITRRPSPMSGSARPIAPGDASAADPPSNAASLLDSAIGHRPLEILNCFAYTCGFSVCAALGGARTTSLDLSKKYLEWGRLNFVLNGLDPAAHDFIYGDSFDWLRRLAKKGRMFDAVLLDPPTFSQSKDGGVFRAEKDYGKLVAAALPVLKPDGVLFASTNAAAWPPEEFVAVVSEAIHKAGRRIAQQHYVPQPPDFPISHAEPAYLKTVWLRVK
jgi:23S rRNA (cytosine1962-C5)-methyltransferase